MTHVITSLCVCYGACLEECPVGGCIVPGTPAAEWPQYYIDPATCIDCGACIPACPFAAIFFEDDVPADYLATGGEYLNLPAKVMPDGEVYIGEDVKDNPVRLEHTRRLEPGEEVDFRGDIEINREYFARRLG